MSKQILSGTKVREKLLSGVQQLSDTVTITLGPKGRNVGIAKVWTNPQVVHDGVTVAKNIELPDPFENFGAQLVQQSSGKTADKAGDGTTTSTLLAYRIFKKGNEAVLTGSNPIDIQNGMNKAVTTVLEALEKRSKPIKTEDEVKQVATVASANFDWGNIIGEAVYKVGKEGVTSVTEYEGLGIEVEYKEGMEFERGYISSMFSTNENNSAELESPYMLITDMTITSADEIAKFLKKFVETTNRQEIVIIASNIGGGALSTLLINKQRSNILPLGIFAPAIGERRKQVLEDIACLTGGKVIYREGAIKLEDVNIEDLGRCDRIVVDDKTTKIVGGFGKSEDIEVRANNLREQIKKEEREFEKEKLQERLSRLVSGAAIIKVGAKTEIELTDKKERVIDAVEATKSALAEGIVAGGGVTYLYLSESILRDGSENKDEQIGFNILVDVLCEPSIKILENAGKSEMFGKLDGKKGIGYDVVGDKIGNMIELGVIDPTRVVKEAIQNAVSVGCVLITTEAVIVDIPEDKKIV